MQLRRGDGLDQGIALGNDRGVGVGSVEENPVACIGAALERDVGLNQADQLGAEIIDQELGGEQREVGPAEVRNAVYVPVAGGLHVGDLAPGGGAGCHDLLVAGP